MSVLRCQISENHRTERQRGFYAANLPYIYHSIKDKIASEASGRSLPGTKKELTDPDSGFREFRCVIVEKRANLCWFARAIFSLSRFLLVPCREFKKAVAAHHRKFSVLVTLGHPFQCSGSSWAVALQNQCGIYRQGLQSLQVSLGHFLVNHSLGFL